MSRPFQSYALVATVAIVLMASQLLLKIGIRGGEPLSLTSLSDLVSLMRRILTTPTLVAGYAISVIAALLWLVTLSRMELSYAIPVLNGFFYVLLMLSSYYVLGEEIDGWRWVGTGLICLGIVVLSRSPA